MVTRLLEQRIPPLGIAHHMKKALTKAGILLKNPVTYWIVAVPLILAILFAHLWKLDSAPMGLFSDETSIGYNAILIGQTAHDEHGQFLPLYFQSFGDFKAPVYIYAAAMVLSILPDSEYTLRFTSALFFFAFLASVMLFVRMFSKKDPVMLYSVIGASFLPWIFTISRIAFEVISQLTLTMWFLAFVFMAFERRPTKKTLWLAIAAGIAAGISVYTYPTARLLAPLFVLVALMLYARRGTWKLSLAFVASFAASLIPYAVYSLQHPGAMTSRFRDITYIFDPSSPATEKLRTFFENYESYFSPRFLLLVGDSNLRHSTGQGGVIFLVVLLLAIVGFCATLMHSEKRRSSFPIFIVLCTFLTPIAASLTSDGTPHALRSILLGLFLLLLSIIGLDRILASPTKPRYAFAIASIALLTVNAVLFTTDYFSQYPIRSINDFGTAGMAQEFQIAKELQPESLIVSDTAMYSDGEFYRLTDDPGIDVSIASPEPKVGTCLIYHPDDIRKVESSPLPYSDVTPIGARMRMRCYLNEGE